MTTGTHEFSDERGEQKRRAFSKNKAMKLLVAIPEIPTESLAPPQIQSACFSAPSAALDSCTRDELIHVYAGRTALSRKEGVRAISSDVCGCAPILKVTLNSEFTCHLILRLSILLVWDCSPTSGPRDSA